ncbi:protamine-like protein 99C [Drosophila virilis]|uniref:HMG box domain-containing protein n=1 Tax=Drosophila virilis TaxID=7244 RepID=B4LRZ6_DROVI|nr:protamine-like protein 99C [Drosophila virilis]EDW63672.1 uncharacterized protein Dvir_GJ16066 [Drosophila virilis]
MSDNKILLAQKSLLRGPVTNNGFVNFMRSYAARSRALDIPDVVRGGKAWNRLSPAQRNKYRNVDANDDTDLDDSCCPRKKSPPMCCPKRRRSCPKPCPPKPRCPARRRKPCCRPKCPKPKPRCCKPVCPKPVCPKPCKKYKCQKPGPITNNGYLNFLRVYRRKHCGLSPKELVMKAARAWCRLPECKKDRYRRQACKVTTNCRHKRRRVCTQ